MTNFNYQKIDIDCIERNQYQFFGKNSIMSITENNKVVAYVEYDIQDDVLFVDMIEVIEKESGRGTKIISWLFEIFNCNTIKGVCLCEARSYYFWESLGASFEWLQNSSYDIEWLLDNGIESPFTLSK